MFSISSSCWKHRRLPSSGIGRRHRVHFLSDKSIRHNFDFQFSLSLSIIRKFRINRCLVAVCNWPFFRPKLAIVLAWNSSNCLRWWCRAAPAKNKSTERCTINHPRAAGAREEFRQICIQTRLEKSPWNTRIELEKSIMLGCRWPRPEFQLFYFNCFCSARCLCILCTLSFNCIAH